MRKREPKNKHRNAERKESDGVMINERIENKNDDRKNHPA